MKYNENKKPIVCMMTQSTCYNGTTKGRPVGVLFHDTGARNPEIRRYVQPSDNDPNKNELLSLIGINYNHNDLNHKYAEGGVNAYIGKLADGTVSTVQVLPWNYRPWGCGSGWRGSCNGSPKEDNSMFWIQFEICDDSWDQATRTYKYGTKSYFDSVYKEAIEFAAYICKMFNIDPNGSVKYKGATVPTVLCHSDSHTFGLGSGHVDIYPYFKKYGKSMDTVRADITKLLKNSNTPPQNPGNNDNGTSDNFAAGDVVKIIGDKYYSGGNVPEWVKKKMWIVKSVNKDRVVVNESVDGTAAIMSPFRACDLKNQNSSYDVVETGDLVKITGQYYYSGGIIPKWVLDQNWYVQSAKANNDRIVINKSENGKCAIMSPIKRKDLKVVKKN